MSNLFENNLSTFKDYGGEIIKTDKLTTDTSRKFPVVGVGASAGGLESFKKFLASISEESGMAYILVQHLSPSHDSILPDILARTTDIPVKQITDGCVIAPDHIYVMPENRMLEITGQSLKLTLLGEGKQNMPIDGFFTSLAEVYGPLAVGIVLSGTARDGTEGLRNIREHGGMTFAEDPKSARWEGMPKSAIDAGVVDFVLPPEEMPAKLINVISILKEADAENSGDGLKKILSFVHRNRGVDFSNYKKPTVIRRIDRRMAINQISGHMDYLNFLQENRAEQEALFQDLLIKVTSFFRDPEIFGELRDTVLPKIMENWQEDGTIRLWIAGCATGEEAYSIAICLFDAMKVEVNRERTNWPKLQLFASDISEDAIKKARTGIYGHAELRPLTERQLEDYFTKIEGRYKVIKSLRDSIVFTVHNFLKDPPFVNIDLISCRNVLIYLEPFLQQKALTTFHYALREKGFLLIGKSETTGPSMGLFAPFSKKEKIYTRKQGKGSLIRELFKRDPKDYGAPIKHPDPIKPRTDFARSAEVALLSGFTPANVVVDELWEIALINGDVTPFMGLAEGKPTHQLLKMVRNELAFELRNLLHQAKSSQEKIRKEMIPLTINKSQYSVDIEIVPLADTANPHYLVVFQKAPTDGSSLTRLWKRVEPILAPTKESLVLKENSALKTELEQSREDMRGISEEQEAYNEELQSANEEMLSNNEEMQSLNEELETSKEELESTNEELVVVNRELFDKQEDLNNTVDDLDAVIATMREPFMVLDKDFRILKANTPYYSTFDLKQSDIEGNHFFEIQDRQWNHPELFSLLNKLLPEKRKISDKELLINIGTDRVHNFLFNAREIVREDGSVRRILLSISDITQRRKTEENYLTTINELRLANEQLDQFVNVASHDLQEPLRKIMTFASRITERQESMTMQDLGTYLAKIKTSSERMSALIINLLKYARLKETDELYERTDLNVVMEELLEDFELLIEEKLAELKIGELPTLDAIPLQINQLIYNLVSNALKFTKKGVDPVISISSRRLPKGEIEEHPSLDSKLSYHEIIVADNGIGFPTEYRERIFAMFQRLNPTSKYMGTGIGLAICKKIVENHMGKIFVQSQEGQGSAFHVILPIQI